jgi:hypothetical protein
LGKPELKRQLGRPGPRWMDNIKIDLREIEWSGMDWTGFIRDRNRLRALVITVTNIRISLNALKFLSN